MMIFKVAEHTSDTTFYHTGRSKLLYQVWCHEALRTVSNPFRTKTRTISSLKNEKFRSSRFL